MFKRYNLCLVLLLQIILIQTAYSAIDQANVKKYKVNLTIGLKGQMPISVSTLARPGKKSMISELSEDGLKEIFIEMHTREKTVQNKNGLLLDLEVQRRVRGEIKQTEKVALFVPENQEIEFGLNTKRKKNDLSVSVLAHQL